MNLARDIVFDEEVQAKIASGLEKVYGLARRSYGPKAGISLIEQAYGSPTASRDGVTNVKKIYLEDPIENMVADIAKQAAEQNNRKVGDGTTAVVILAYHLYREARKLLVGGHNRMEIALLLEETAQRALEQIEKISLDTDDKLLRYVAEVSSGSPDLGAMVADVIESVGAEGGVTIEDYKGLGIVPEVVDGFYFRKGFTNINLINDAANLESHHTDVAILITEKRLNTVVDIAPLLEKIVGAGLKDLVVVGDLGDEALSVLLLNRMKGIISTTVVDLPIFSGLRSVVMEDLAVLTGGKVYTTGGTPEAFTPEMLGIAAKVEVTSYSTAIIGADGADEDIEARLVELREQLKSSTNPTDIEAVKDRLARLTGKVAIIRVGGATDIEQQEVKLRVQDAVSAVQAAVEGGVCPGGGVALARLSIDPRFEQAFKQPFRTLCENAGQNSELLLGHVEQARDWYGYDFRNPTSRPVELMRAGIVDPTLVLKEVVTNATSIVSKLVTVNSAITYKDREQKRD
jgi:chaperonin GroEL